MVDRSIYVPSQFETERNLRQTINVEVECIPLSSHHC
jgi:hypothetical protein